MSRRFWMATFAWIVLATTSTLCFAIGSTDFFSLFHVVPVAADWNHDGHLDLLISTRQGNVFVLRSRNGLETADFDAVYPLMYTDDGVEGTIFHFWEWTAPSIDAADWNGDGLLDLLIVNSNRTITYYQRRRDSNGDLTLDPPTTLRFSDDTPLGYPICRGHWQKMAMRVVDWDLDGTNDLVLGENECYYLRNLGTATSPRFDRPTGWTSEEWCVESGSFKEYALFELSAAYAVPNVVDWDNDGRLDVVCGLAWRFSTSDETVGFIIYRKNEGTNSSPSFPDESVDPSSIMFLRSDPNRDFIRQGEYSVPYVCDVDSNGWADLLVGGDGPLRLYTRNAQRELELVWDLTEISY
ncbi:FG-GAP repeat domain-containing protein [Candidatus Bipolaricaulota bacterium]